MSSFGSPPGKVEWRAVAGTSPKSRKPVPGRTSLGGGSPAQAAELPLWDKFPKVNMPFPGGSGLSIRRSSDPRRGSKGEITQYLAGMAAKRIFLRVSYIPAARSPSGRREFDCALDTSPARVEAAESRFPRRRWAAFGGIRPPGPGRPGLPGQATWATCTDRPHRPTGSRGKLRPIAVHPRLARRAPGTSGSCLANWSVGIAGRMRPGQSTSAS